MFFFGAISKFNHGENTRKDDELIIKVLKHLFLRKVPTRQFMLQNWIFVTHKYRLRFYLARGINIFERIVLVRTVNGPIKLNIYLVLSSRATTDFFYAKSWISPTTDPYFKRHEGRIDHRVVSCLSYRKKNLPPDSEKVRHWNASKKTDSHYSNCLILRMHLFSLALDQWWLPVKFVGEWCSIFLSSSFLFHICSCLIFSCK